MWDVETDKGPRQFSMGRDQNRVGQWGAHGRVVRDLDDNRYVIPDMRALDPTGWTMFNREVYWCPYEQLEAEREDAKARQALAAIGGEEESSRRSR